LSLQAQGPDETVRTAVFERIVFTERESFWTVNGVSVH
jgi:hypothetical protein